MENPGSQSFDALERRLYEFRDPSPPQVGGALGISGQHVKNLCRELRLPMRNIASKATSKPTWRIPLETFRELRKRLRAAHAQNPVESEPPSQ